MVAVLPLVFGALRRTEEGGGGGIREGGRRGGQEQGRRKISSLSPAVSPKPVYSSSLVITYKTIYVKF